MPASHDLLPPLQPVCAVVESRWNAGTLRSSVTARFHTLPEYNYSIRLLALGKSRLGSQAFPDSKEQDSYSAISASYSSVSVLR